MSQTKQLLSVVEDIRRLADSLQSLCAVMTEEKLEQTFVEEKSELVGDESTELLTNSTKEDQTITLEEVRGVLAKKAQEGKQAEVRELIKTYGVSKLSEVEAKHYVELMKKAEEL
jgi:Ca2+-binding EF-hand superfamily protein